VSALQGRVPSSTKHIGLKIDRFL